MERNKSLTLTICVIIIIWMSFVIRARNNTIESLRGDIENYEYRIDDYSEALSEANDNIEEANSNIEDAQGYAWSNYYDMGYALDNLKTVDTVSEP